MKYEKHAKPCKQRAGRMVFCTELAKTYKTTFSEGHQMKWKHLQEKRYKWMELYGVKSAMKLKFLKPKHEVNIRKEKKFSGNRSLFRLVYKIFIRVIISLFIFITNNWKEVENGDN